MSLNDDSHGQDLLALHVAILTELKDFSCRASSGGRLRWSKLVSSLCMSLMESLLLSRVVSSQIGESCALWQATAIPFSKKIKKMAGYSFFES